MSHLLITNDHGIEAPALVPLARALSLLGKVEVVVPDRERSWIAKAITRHEEISVQRRERDGFVMYATTGYPADCTQLGIHSLFEHTPRLVVSGINIGFNHGAAYLLSSGTVGAALEAWISGIPAVALSAGTNGDWPSWSRWAWTAAAIPMWERLAAVGAEIVSTLLEEGFPPETDVISVNMPEDADLDTRRRVVELARVGYDRLFVRRGPDVYAHEFGGGFVHFRGLDGTDIEATRRGEVAITPLQLPQTVSIPDDLRSGLER